MLVTRLFLFFIITFLWMGRWIPPVWAQEAPSGTTPLPATIETHWDSIWGMQYRQNGRTLTGLELKNLIDSSGDPRTITLLRKSETNETWGDIGLGGSIALSAACLFLPGTILHVGGWKISLPCLPAEIPALVLGVASTFLGNAAGADKYGAVQRYNRAVKDPGPVTWDISPRQKGLMLDLNYAL
jgi:hypothetical protein